MISIDKLSAMAKNLGIRVIFKNLKKHRPGLLGMADAESKTITIDESLLKNQRELRCVLSEEIGHIVYPPRSGHVAYHSKGFYQAENCSVIKHTVAQDERKALDWATGVLLGHVEFDRIKAVGARSISELADYFDVEPWFIEHRIGYLRRKVRDAGQKVRWRDLIRRV